MRIYADLHIHSRYSRATSTEMSIPNLSFHASRKGLNVLGTGDFTHPAWMKEIKSHLQPSSFEGFYSYGQILFVLSSEVNTHFYKGEKAYRMHHIILAPSLEAAESLNGLLSQRGDLKADGRPTLRMSPSELMDSVLEVGSDLELIPAHIWTPYFSLFGSKSGVDTVEEAFEDASSHVHALETGLSSDPPMNWRLSSLDKYALVSFSDSHSPWSWRIGRELIALELKEAGYKEMLDAIRSKDRSRFLFTLEVDPNYGKYHYDGHAKCGVRFHPREAMRLNSRCPVCGRRLTIGVLHRVEELADRPEGRVPLGAIGFMDMLPLYEIISYSLGIGQKYSKKVLGVYNSLIDRFGSELKILLEVPLEEIAGQADEKIADGVRLMRGEKLRIDPGYDGVYGTPLFDREKKDQVRRAADLERYSGGDRNRFHSAEIERH